MGLQRKYLWVQETTTFLPIRPWAQQQWISKDGIGDHCLEFLILRNLFEYLWIQVFLAMVVKEWQGIWNPRMLRLYDKRKPRIEEDRLPKRSSITKNNKNLRPGPLSPPSPPQLPRKFPLNLIPLLFLMIGIDG